MRWGGADFAVVLFANGQLLIELLAVAVSAKKTETLSAGNANGERRRARGERKGERCQLEEEAVHHNANSSSAEQAISGQAKASVHLHLDASMCA